MSKVLVHPYGRVRVLTVNRPEVHNCVDGETAEGIAEAIMSFADDDDARVLIVTGSGDKAFCSGADLRNPHELLSHRFLEQAGPMGFARLDPGKPTIAAVNGYCFAGGMELALWCDFRVAASNAEFGALNRRWGVPFTDGATQRLPRIVGQGAALYLIETGIRISAERAMALGLVQEVVPQGSCLERALELAERIGQYPQISLRADRKAAIEGLGLTLAQGMDLEQELCLPTVYESELQAGLARFVSGDRPEALR